MSKTFHTKRTNPSGLKGFLAVNKPVGLSSFQVVYRVRKLSGVPKVGHAGTLDPFASGLLILALDRSYTRRIDQFLGASKTYTFTMVLGMTTDTLDTYGQIIEQRPLNSLTQAQVEAVLPQFTGEIQQVPPQYSAKKINGQRMYLLARKGEAVELEPSTVMIHNLHLDSFRSGPFPQVTLTVACSKGTYVRSLVRDIAEALGTVAYTRDLIRVNIAEQSLDQAVQYADLSEELIQSHLFR